MPAHWRRQQDMHRHVFPVIVDGELVNWQQYLLHLRTVHICIVIEGRGASADPLAPATEHAPAHIPNRRRFRGPLAQRL